MLKIVSRIAGAGAVLAAMAGGAAFAADSPEAKEADEVSVWSPWMVRGRVLIVEPDASGSIAGIPGADVDIDTSVVPELDITYFFTPNIAVELILGVTPHDITGAGAIAGIPVGEAWLLPPTLTLQYHFTNFGAFKPYVGGGVNYTVFFDEDAAGGAVTRMDIEDTFGGALQAGFDYMLNSHWGINVDVKKIFLRPDVKLVVGGVPTRGKVDIDPWLIGFGVTYRH